LTSEHHEEIELEIEYEFESKDFNLDQIVDFTVHWVSNPIPLNPEPKNLTQTFTEPLPPLELKSHLNHLKYFYLGGN